MKAPRVILASLVLATPLVGDRFPFLLFPAVAGTVLAYDGVSESGALILAAWLFLAELLWGFDWGVLSLAFVLTVLCIWVAEHFVTAQSLRHEPGWHLVPIVRAILLAVVTATLMSVLSILIQSLVYGQGLSVRTALFSSDGLVHSLPALVLFQALAVVVLRRIDTPFRRRISFGTS